MVKVKKHLQHVQYDDQQNAIFHVMLLRRQIFFADDADSHLQVAPAHLQ